MDAQEEPETSPTKVKLIRADAIEYDNSLAKAQRIIGNVLFEHNGAKMYCDSAWLYEEKNALEAWGDIRIRDEDGLSIQGDELVYDGDSLLAELRGERVILRDQSMTLNTQYVQYHTEDRLASYYGGGRIINSKNRNVLTSEAGTYFAASKIFHFKDSVILENPKYTIHTDTLHYHDYNGQAFFFGPTDILAEENSIYCENGWYDTMKERARFGENAELWNKDQRLTGDSIYYDRNLGRGEAFGSVVILDTLNQIQISGKYGKHLEEAGESLVTEQALMEQFFDTDTLSLHADTLLMSADTLEMKRILAYHGVRIYKPDLQGSCDSLVYAEADSLIRMYQEPFVWSEENQINGEFIDLYTFDGSIQRIYTESMAFIISQVDSVHYNQIKGRTLNGLFIDDELRTVLIEGNGECIYYALEEEEEPTDSLLTEEPPKIIGVNKAECSRMRIKVMDNEIQQVSFLTEPDNAFYPLKDISESELILKDFQWKGSERPLSKDDLFTTGETSSSVSEFLEETEGYQTD